METGKLDFALSTEKVWDAGMWILEEVKTNIPGSSQPVPLPPDKYCCKRIFSYFSHRKQVKAKNVTEEVMEPTVDENR